MSSLIKNSAWSLLAQSGKIITQAGLFILLARGLGVHEFGLYMAIFSIAQLAFTLPGLGTHNTMVMRVSRCPRLLPYYLGTPLFSTILIGAVLTVLLSINVYYLYEVSLWVAGFILLTELVAYRLIDVATNAWQSMENIKRGATTYLLISAVRVLLAAGLISFSQMNIQHWAISNMIVTFAIAIYSLLRLIYTYNIKLKKMKLYIGEIKKGIFFSFSGCSQSINANIDKVALSKLSTLSDLGIYSVAFRVVQMGLLPMLAVFQATYPRYFKAGQQGIAGSLAFSRKLAPPMLAYGICASIGLILSAPLLPWIMGSQYQQSVVYIQLLSLLPLIQVAQYLLGDAMSGAGLQRPRALLQLLITAISIILNIVLISLFNTIGAVLSVLIGELLLLLGYVVVVVIFLKR